MHKICLLSLKGGAGKSTVVQSLAVCAHQHGQNTLIVELDPQGSLKKWSKRRENPEPQVYQTLPQSLDDVLQEAEEQDTHWVFLDTPGHDASTAAAAAAHADLIIIPCKIQSMKDFDSVMLTLAEANRANKPAYVLMNQVPPNSPKLVRAKQLEIQREYQIAVLSKYLCRRADFEYCDARGLSAAEFRPNGTAAKETLALYSLIQSIFITLNCRAPASSATPDASGVASADATDFSTPGMQQPESSPHPTPGAQAVALPRDISLPVSAAPAPAPPATAASMDEALPHAGNERKTRETEVYSFTGLLDVGSRSAIEAPRFISSNVEDESLEVEEISLTDVEDTTGDDETSSSPHSQTDTIPPDDAVQMLRDAWKVRKG